MATFYKVITKVTRRKAFVSYGGEVESQTQPSNTFKSLPMYDIYEDYFDTKEDADNFISQNTTKMIVYGK